MNLTINSISFSEGTTLFNYEYLNLSNPISPGNTDSIYVNFSPINAGTFIDSILIENDSENLTNFKIEVSGTGEYAPPKEPENVTINMVDDNAVITWDVVTENIYNSPIAPDGYIVLYNEILDDDYYWFLADTTELTYTHQNVGLHRENMFYRVRAFIFYDELMREYLSSLNPEEKISWKQISKKLSEIESRNLK